MAGKLKQDDLLGTFHPKLLYDKARSVLVRRIKKILKAVQEKELGMKMYWVRFFSPRENQIG